MRVLLSTLALLPATAAATVHKETIVSRLRVYHGKRCQHGVAGIIVRLHNTAAPVAFRRELAAFNRSGDVFHQDYLPINAFGMSEIHPETLTHVAGHDHTLAIEAACIVQKSMPTITDVEATASLFHGRYRSAVAITGCEHTIEPHRPWSRISTATVSIHSPAGGYSTCDTNGTTDVVTQYDGVIHMVGAHVGTLSVTMPETQWHELQDSQNGAGFGFGRGSGTGGIGGRGGSGSSSDTRNRTKIYTGAFAIDPEGRMEDTIEWYDGSSWTHVPGLKYDLDTPIGPLDDGDGLRTRNPKSLVRWNWALDRIDGPNSALDDTYRYGKATGAGTTLYNLDVGVMIHHDDLEGRAVGGYSVGCRLGTEKGCLTKWVYRGVVTEDVMARSGSCSTHGTHTTSTAAGSLYGVARGAHIVAVQVLNCDGSGSDLGLLDGMSWALRHAREQSPRRPAVVSMSLGGSERSDSLDEMVKTMSEAGVLVVVAAGNDAADACGGSPASSAYALTVGATGMTEPQIVDGRLVEGIPPTYDTLASFSDDGACVDVYAPGDEILAAVPDANSTHYTSIMSGTSMATPVVAGVALQLLGLYPYFSPDDVTRAILCLCVQGAIIDLSSHDRAYFLQGGAQITEPHNAALIAAQYFNETVSATVPPRDATQCYQPAGSVQAVPSRREQQQQQQQQRVLDPPVI